MKKLLISIATLFIGFAANTAMAQEVIALQNRFLSYNFGSQFLNSLSYADFTLTSSDTEATEIRELTIAGYSYDLRTNCPRIIPAKAKCTIRVYFQPRMEGFQTGRAVIYLKDDNYIIDLSGWGIK